MRTAVFVLLLVFVLPLSACTGEISYHNDVQQLSGLDISGSTVISSKDDHGGIHGDGATMVEFDCAGISDKVTQQAGDWNPLPLSENLQLIMYGGIKDGIDYGYNLAEEYRIPEVQNGCYYFVDRHSESADSANDRDLFDRFSFNFSLIIFDSDTAHLYLFEFDT